MPTAKLAKELGRAQAGFSLESGANEIRQALQAQYALAASLHSHAFPFFAKRIEVDSKKHISLEQIWGQLNVLLAPVLAKVNENMTAYESRVADGGARDNQQSVDAGVPRKRARNEPLPEHDAKDGDAGDNDENEQTTESPKRRRKAADEGDKDAWRYAFGRGHEDDEDDEDDVNLDDDGNDDLGTSAHGFDDNGDDAEGAVASVTRSDEDGDDYGDEEGEGDDDEDDRAALKELYGSDFSDDDARVGEFPDEEDEEDGEEDFELDDVEREAGKILRRRKHGEDDDDHDGHVDGDDDILNDVANEFGANDGPSGEVQEDEDNDPNLTKYQAEREREKRRIAQMEEERLYGANWAMGGEVGASARPKDSLVTETLDFEHTMKPVPVNTEHTTAQLEERIKRRILEKRFDDVERRRVRSAADDLVQTKTDASIDAEKSKFSLMDLYEKEFLEKMKRAEESGPGGAVETAEPLTEIEKDELRAVQLWKRLSQHLDALSNFFYTPKPAKQDLDARVRAVDHQAPAIRIENVGNFAISRENALAPQDLFRPSNRAKAGVSVDEMDPKEKRGLRRAKKESYASTKERKQKQLEKRQGPPKNETNGGASVAAKDKAVTKPRK